MKFLAMTTVVLAALAVSVPPATADNQENRNKDGSFISDAALTTKVKAALAEDAGLKTVVLDVDSDEGAVRISGDVKSKREKEAISRIARNVEGVKSVNNDVKVRP